MVSRVLCVCVSGGFGVCVEGGKVVFEEILRQLKILLGGSNKAGLLKIRIKGLEHRGMQRRELWRSELVCLTRRLWTVADAPSRVSHRRTIH